MAKIVAFTVPSLEDGDRALDDLGRRGVDDERLCCALSPCPPPRSRPDPRSGSHRR